MQPDKPLAGSAEDWLRHAGSDLALAKVHRNTNDSMDLNDAKALTDYAVSTRYPGDFEEVTDEELKQAIQTAESVLDFAVSIIQTRS